MALAAVQDLCARMDTHASPYWLSLIGKSGRGKTMLAKAAYRHFMRCTRFNVQLDVVRQRIYGNTGQFVDWRSFCDDLREGCFGRVDDICEEHFVVIDDIGAEYDPSGFVTSKLDRIANERIGKWTLITCNLGLEQIAEKLDTRIASRMIRDRNIVVEIDAPDYALRTH